MNTTRNTILIVLLFAAAAFIGGYLWKGSPEDSSMGTPTPSVTVIPSPSPSPSKSPVAVIPPRTYTVTYSASGVAPSVLTIRAGDIVRFVNEGSTEVWPASDPHPSHTNCSGFDAKRGLRTGEVYALSFPIAKTCSYHSHLNPSATALQGTIIVR